MTTAEVVATVVQTVALGGNALINIGPAHDGSIDPIFADRLMGLGAWLGVNGEAIYESQPWAVAQNDTAAAAWFTASADGSAVFATLLAWPAGGVLALAAPTGVAASTAVSMLGVSGLLVWAPRGAAGQPGIVVTLPSLAPGSALGAAPAWTLKMVGLAKNTQERH